MNNLVNRRVFSSVDARRAMRKAVAACRVETLERRQLLAGDISGNVFNDLNRNGSADVGELGLESIAVYLDQNSNGQHDNGEPFALTDIDGNYTIVGVPNGENTLRLSIPGDWVITLPVDETYTVDTTGGDVVNRNFATTQMVGTIRGTATIQGGGSAEGYSVYVDLDQSGTLTDGDLLSDVDENGQWEFQNVMIGTHYIRINPGIDYIPNASTNHNSTVSDGGALVTIVTPWQDETIGTFTLLPDDETTTVIGGEVLLNGGSVDGRTVFIDSNNNGILDDGERSRVSDQNGQFLFTNVTPGVYTLVVIPGPDDVALDIRGTSRVVAATNPSSSYLNSLFYLGRKNGTIAGVVYPARTGVVDPDYVPYGTQGMTVFLDTVIANGILDDGEPLTVTDVNGWYYFEDLDPGDYTVQVVLGETDVAMSPAHGRHQVTLQSANSFVESNFYYRNSLANYITVSGTVYQSYTGDGFGESLRKPSERVHVYADLNNNGVMDDGERRNLINSDGTYTLDSLPTGNYPIRIYDKFILDWEVTVPSGGGAMQSFGNPVDLATDVNFTLTLPKAASYVQNDFNGDGKADLYFNDSTTGDTYIWLMDGNQRIGTTALQNKKPGWTLAATGDFNRDNKTDIVWHNDTTGETEIWLMDRHRQLLSVTLPTVNPAFRVYGAGDFDGDGHADLVFRNVNTGSASVWFLENGRLRNQNAFGVLPQVTTQDWQIADVRDYNGDGDPDLLWTNATTKQNSLWMMNGHAVANDGFRGIPYPTAAGWKLTAVSDFNNDGTPDLLWANGSNRSIWQLDDVTSRPVKFSFEHLLV